MIIRWKRKTTKNDLVFHTAPLSADDFSARFCSRTDFVHKIKHQKSEDYIKESQYIRIIWAEHERVLSSFKHDARKRKNNTSKQIIALARCTDLFLSVTTLTVLLKLCDVISSNDLLHHKLLVMKSHCPAPIMFLPAISAARHCSPLCRTFRETSREGVSIETDISAGLQWRD